MKKMISVCTTALLVAGLLTIGVMSSASATECVPSEAVAAVPAVTHEELVTAEVLGQPYVAPTFETVVITEAVEAVAEVSHTEYQFEFKKPQPNSPRWETKADWNADDNENSHGWHSTGETRTVVDAPAVAGSDAVTEEVMTDAGQPAIERADAVYTTVTDSEAIPAKDAVTCPPVTPEVPTKPEVTVTTDVHESTDCLANFIAFITTTTTTDWKLVENVWEEDVTVTESTAFREPTDEECAPVVVPPVVVPPVTVEPPVVVTPPVETPPLVVTSGTPPVKNVLHPAHTDGKELADTGANAGNWFLLALLLSLTGAVALLATRWIKHAK